LSLLKKGCKPRRSAATEPIQTRKYGKPEVKKQKSEKRPSAQNVIDFRGGLVTFLKLAETQGKKGEALKGGLIGAGEKCGERR